MYPSRFLRISKYSLYALLIVGINILISVFLRQDSIFLRLVFGAGISYIFAVIIGLVGGILIAFVPEAILRKKAILVAIISGVILTSIYFQYYLKVILPVIKD